MIRLEEPVGMAQVAQRLGVSREAVRLWTCGISRAGFPEPKFLLNGHFAVWDWPDVRRWAEQQHIQILTAR